MHMNFSLMTRRGRIQVKEAKERTRGRPIVPASIPDELIFPLAMHIGAAATAVVEVGDFVKRGQLIAEASSFISSNIFASVSGQVTAIEERPTDKGMATAIVIQNDHKDEMAAPLPIPGPDAKAEQIIEAVRQAGIVGMGGAAFPTAVKLKPPPEMTIDTLIINGSECEPYSTSDHRVMLEFTDEIIEGIEISSRLYPDLKNIFIVVENNKADAVKKLRALTKDKPQIQVKSFSSLYPTGAEKSLITRLTGREVGPGALPADVHSIVLNVSTIRAVRRAVILGEPLIDRVVSITGDAVKDAKNLLARIGTPIESLIQDCGGLEGDVDKIILGGPMMGRPLKHEATALTKSITSITVLGPKDTKVGERQACIMCSECLNVCPVNLQPILISEAYERGQIEEAKALGAMDCIECGNCSYICPSKIPILDNIRKAKSAIRAAADKG